MPGLSCTAKTWLKWKKRGAVLSDEDVWAAGPSQQQCWVLQRLICPVNSINYFFSLVERSACEVQISQAKQFFPCLLWVKCSTHGCLSSVQLQHLHFDVPRWFSPGFIGQLSYISLPLGSVNEIFSLHTCVMFSLGYIYDWVQVQLLFRDCDKAGKQYGSVLVQASLAMLCPWPVLLQLHASGTFSIPFACRGGFEQPEFPPWLKALYKIHTLFRFFMH